MGEQTVPAILTVADVARILSWDYDRTRRWLLKHELVQKRGGVLITTPAKVRDRFQGVWLQTGDTDDPPEH